MEILIFLAAFLIAFAFFYHIYDKGKNSETLSSHPDHASPDEITPDPYGVQIQPYQIEIFLAILAEQKALCLDMQSTLAELENREEAITREDREWLSDIAKMIAETLSETNERKSHYQAMAILDSDQLVKHRINSYEKHRDYFIGDLIQLLRYQTMLNLATILPAESEYSEPSTLQAREAAKLLYQTAQQSQTYLKLGHYPLPDTILSELKTDSEHLFVYLLEEEDGGLSHQTTAFLNHIFDNSKSAEEYCRGDSADMEPGSEKSRHGRLLDNIKAISSLNLSAAQIYTSCIIHVLGFNADAPKEIAASRKPRFAILKELLDSALDPDFFSEEDKNESDPTEETQAQQEKQPTTS